MSSNVPDAIWTPLRCFQQLRIWGGCVCGHWCWRGLASWPTSGWKLLGPPYLLLCLMGIAIRSISVSPNQSNLIYISFIYLNHVSELATFWGDILVLQLKWSWTHTHPYLGWSLGSFSEWIRKLLSLISMSGLRKNPGGSWATESEGIAMHRCSRRRSCTEASGSNFTCYSPISEWQKSLENG